MFTQMNTYLTITLVICSVLLLIALTICIALLIHIKHNTIEMSRVLYILFKKNKTFDDSTDDIKHALVTIHENIGSLSTSTKQVIDDYRVTRDQSILPTPQLSNMIKETIKEQITIESLLSRQMRIPNGESTNHIIENTVQTYPNVDNKYIVKLCLAMIENFNLNNSQSQN